MSVHTFHGIRCGNRKQHGTDVVYHATTQEVKDCFAESGAFNFGTLVHEAAEALAPVKSSHVAMMEQAEAYKAAERERQAARDAEVRAEAERREAARQRYAAWRSIPVFSKGRGYYALPYSVEGETVHPMFFRVERPTTGKHAGKTFVRVQASDTFHNLSWHVAADVLDRIAADPAAAALRYAREIGKCSRCNRTLTDDESRARGMGPDCWRKWGA